MLAAIIPAAIGAGASIYQGWKAGQDQKKQASADRARASRAYQWAAPNAKQAHGLAMNDYLYNKPTPGTDLNAMATWDGSSKFFQKEALQPGQNTQNVRPLDQGRAFDSLTAFDPRPEYAQAKPVDLEGFYSGIQAYNPAEFIKQAGAPPSLKQMLSMGRVTESEFEKISTDPKLKNLQMQALGQLQEIAENNGMTIADRVRLRESMDAVARQQRMQRYAIMQHYESVGMAGSGAEMAASMAASQESVETMADAGAKAAAAGSERAQAAVIQMGEMATSLRAQEFEEASKKAQAKDAIAMFNASQSLDAIKAEWNMRMEQAKAFADAGEMYFENILALQTAKSNARRDSWEMRFKYADAMANAGQEWWRNTLDLTQARVNVRQQAYDNAFTWAQAVDNFIQMGWENYMDLERAKYGAAYDGYNSYVEKLKMQEDQARWLWGAQQNQLDRSIDSGYRLSEFMLNDPNPPMTPGEQAASAANRAAAEKRFHEVVARVGKKVNLFGK